jgi:hypothetical protein
MRAPVTAESPENPVLRADVVMSDLMIIAFGVQQPKMERFVARRRRRRRRRRRLASAAGSRVVRWPHGNPWRTRVTSRSCGLNVLLLV